MSGSPAQSDSDRSPVRGKPSITARQYPVFTLSVCTHRDVLIDRGGEVWIVDLATAWVAGRRRGSLFERFCELDLLSVARMRARGLGRDPDQAVTELGGRAAAWHRRGRRIKRWRNRLRRRPRP